MSVHQVPSALLLDVSLSMDAPMWVLSLRCRCVSLLMDKWCVALHLHCCSCVRGYINRGGSGQMAAERRRRGVLEGDSPKSKDTSPRARATPLTLEEPRRDRRGAMSRAMAAGLTSSGRLLAPPEPLLVARS